MKKAKATIGSARRDMPPRPVERRTNLRRRFSPEIFTGLSDDLSSGRTPLERVTVSDDVVVGLRAIIRDTGLISFHMSYPANDGSRPYMKVGDFPAMSVEEARHIGRTIRQLSEMGIDVHEGLHSRLIRELKEQGTKWRPDDYSKPVAEESELQAALKPLLAMGIDEATARKTVLKMARKSAADSATNKG